MTAPANDTAAAKATLTSGADMKVGQKREDGTVYLGYFKDKKDSQYKDFFVTAEDARDDSGKRLAMNFNQASGYVKSLDIHGKKDWQLAEDDILNEQYEARSKGEFKGTYDESGYYHSSRYLSATENPNIQYSAWVQWFDVGKRNWEYKDDDGSVRPVRAELRP